MVLLGFVVVVLLAGRAVGEPVVGIHWDWSPEAAITQRFLVTDVTPPPTSESGGGAYSEATEYEAFGWHVGHAWADQSLRLRYTRRTIARVGPERYLNGPFPRDLYTLGLQWDWTLDLGPSQQVEVCLSPLLENASENTIGLGDIKFAGGGLIRRLDVEGFDLGLGAAWSRSYGRDQLLPLLEIARQFEDDRMSVHLLIPISASITFEAAPWLDLGAQLVQQGGEYRTDDEDTREDEWVRYWSSTFGPSATIALGDTGFRVFTRVGVEFDRRHDGIETDGTRFLRQGDRSRMLQVSLSYGPEPNLSRIGEAQGWR